MGMHTIPKVYRDFLPLNKWFSTVFVFRTLGEILKFTGLHTILKAYKDFLTFNKLLLTKYKKNLTWPEAGQNQYSWTYFVIYSDDSITTYQTVHMAEYVSVKLGNGISSVQEVFKIFQRMFV